MWELEDRNPLDVATKRKICEFCEQSDRVKMSRTAERDLALTPVTKVGLLQAMKDHIEAGKCVNGDYMDNGDLAFNHL